MNIQRAIGAVALLCLAGCVSTGPGANTAFDLNGHATPSRYAAAAIEAANTGRLELVIRSQADVERLCGGDTWGCSTHSALLLSSGRCLVTLSEEVPDVRTIAYLLVLHEGGHCVGWSNENGVDPAAADLAYVNANAERLVALAMRPTVASGPGMTAAQIASYAAAFCASLPERRRPEACV